MTLVAPEVEAALLRSLRTGLFIDGSWCDSNARDTFPVCDPATGQNLSEVANAGVPDAIAALDAAAAAADGWADARPRERSQVLRRVFDLLQERSDDVALLITLEMGKPLAEARGEVAYGGEFLRWFSEEAVRVAGRSTRHPDGAGEIMVTPRPVGPCYLITPWNFPLAMATRKIGAALAAGCTAILKPAELTPLTSLLLAELFEEAGLPPGVLNVIPTLRAAEVSQTLMADRRLRKLSFTGSTAVGKLLARQAVDTVLRVSLELGGNAPFVVFDDADLARAVDGAVHAKFRNMGQACTAANRFLVHRSVAEEFTDRLVERVTSLRTGRGTDPVDVGPLISDAAASKVDALIRDAVRRGARVLYGGTRVGRAGAFYRPTVLRDVPSDSALLAEEIFGPVVAIVEFEDEDEAVDLANDTEYGLASYVFTKDLARSRRMIDRLDAGMMGLNTGLISTPAAPFGGVKHSGTGREGGIEGIHEYLSLKYTLHAG